MQLVHSLLRGFGKLFQIELIISLGQTAISEVRINYLLSDSNSELWTVRLIFENFQKKKFFFFKGVSKVFFCCGISTSERMLRRVFA